MQRSSKRKFRRTTAISAKGYNASKLVITSEKCMGSWNISRVGLSYSCDNCHPMGFI
jgi:hypothetical protein